MTIIPIRHTNLHYLGRIIMVFQIILVASLLRSQEDIGRWYTRLDGLPSNTVYDLEFDTLGYLWIATDQGVSRFDGNQFTNYTTEDGLPDNEILKIRVDSKNRTWLYGFNGKVGLISNRQIVRDTANYWSKINADNFISFAHEHDNGDVYLSIPNDHIIKYNENSELETYPFSNVTIFSNNGKIRFVNTFDSRIYVNELQDDGSIDSLYLSPTGIKMLPNKVGSDDDHLFILFHFEENNKLGICRLNKHNLKAKFFRLAAQPDGFNIMLQRLNDKLYIGSDHELQVYKVSADSIELIKTMDGNYTSVVEDYQGNIWMGNIKKGLQVFSSTLPVFSTAVSHTIEQISIHPSLDQILVGGADAITTLSSTPPFEVKKTKTYPKSAKLYGIHQGYDKNYYAFNDNLVIESKEGVREYRISAKAIFAHPPSETVALATTSGLVIEKESDLRDLAEMEFIPDIIRAISIKRRRSGEYVAGMSEGLATVEDRKTTLIPEIQTRINNIFIDSEVSEWYISELNGIYHFNGTEIKHLDQAYGIKSNLIRAACFADSVLYVAHNQGIDKLRYIDGAYYHQNIVLPQKYIESQITSIDKIDNYILLGTAQGLYYLDLKTIDPTTSSTRLILDKIMVNGQTTTEKNLLNLATDERNVMLQFDHISYLSSEIKYNYSLDNGKSWNMTTQSLINFANLSPDNYKIKVFAVNEVGTKSNTVSLDINIESPFYKKWWFFAILTVLAGTIMFLWNKVTILKVEDSAAIQKEIAMSQQKALRAQMNPHFLFNALNSIQQFFLEDNDLDGQEYVSKFSKLIRATLDNSDQDFILLENEITNLKRYVELEQIRLKNGFEFQIEIDPKLDSHSVSIPTMILQPVIENSIWHGIKHLKDRRGLIRLICSQEANHYTLTVKDNGVGRAASRLINKARTRKSKGNELIKDRINAINRYRDINITIKVRDLKPTGTSVTFTIPEINEVPNRR